MLVEEMHEAPGPDGPVGLAVVRPEGDGPFPVVVSFHHGPGLDDGSKEAMARIAEWGCYVVSHDRYHRHEPWLVMDLRTPDEAERNRFWTIFLGTTDAMVAADVAALLSFVDQDPAAADGPMGCIGYCIGARSALRTLADEPERFRAGVALHPSLCTTDEPDSPHLSVPGLTSALYVGFGSEDRMQPVADNQALIDLVEALPTGEVEIHEGADHGFAVPRSGHHPAAADRANERARAIFGTALG